MNINQVWYRCLYQSEDYIIYNKGVCKYTRLGGAYGRKKNLDSLLKLATHYSLISLYNPGTTEVKSQSLVSTEVGGSTGSEALLMLHVAH